ncbi:MAG: hypothetical protein ACLP50_11725 [Solirubrobacteraceae bacterium]
MYSTPRFNGTPPVPCPPTRTQLQALIELAEEIGDTVAFAPTGRGDGYCSPQAKRIVVAAAWSRTGGSRS